MSLCPAQVALVSKGRMRGPRRVDEARAGRGGATSEGGRGRRGAGWGRLGALSLAHRGLISTCGGQQVVHVATTDRQDRMDCWGPISKHQPQMGPSPRHLPRQTGLQDLGSVWSVWCLPVPE